MKHEDKFFQISLLLVFLISSLSTTSAAVTQRLDGQLILTETQITTDESKQYSPSIDSDRVIWVELNDGNTDIHLYNLSTSKENQITTNGMTSSPVIYKDKIVWWDNRKGNFDIYMYDISTSDETQITTNELYQTYPAIYEDRIVWQDMRDGGGYTSDIYMYNISTLKEIQITKDSSDQENPAIYGDRIVWADLRNGNADIYMYNISTSTETQITADSSSQDCPSIYGDRIIWLDSRRGSYDIYMYNLTTSEETRITTNESLVQPRNPKIYGDRIVWEDNRNRNADIYMYDISTHEETQITIDKSEQYSPTIYSDTIVWMDSRNVNADIYMCVISEKGQEPIVLIPTAEFSTNVTSGYSPLSVQFTDLSEYAMSRVWDFNNDGICDSNDVNPVYVYAVPGTYTINLTVSNEKGTASKLSNVRVFPSQRVSGQFLLEETRITTNESDQRYPAIYSDKIVWEDLRNGWENPDIYMYNISTGKEIPITTNEAEQYYPDIYGDVIVWEDMRNGNADIYMYNLSTCKETQLTDNEGGQRSPVIYGDRIVWSDSNDKNYSIYMYNLCTSKETRITTNENTQMLPAIYEDRIVWQDWRNGIFDIFLYNISTSKETQITASKLDQHNKSDQYNPAIYGDTLAWENTRNMGIYVYNLSTFKKTLIIDGGVNHAYPAIYSDRIVWDDWRDVTGINTNIYMYNLSTSKEIQITTEESWQLHPDIHGDRIVWQDYRNGNFDIFMCTVKNNQKRSNSTEFCDITLNNSRESSSISGGGSSGGGGAGGSPEPAKNVKSKELCQGFITSGKAVKLDFTKNATPIVSLNFDSKKTVGKTTTIVETLKNKSALTKETPEGEVYNYLNIWVGNGGYGSDEDNLENAVINFKVEKTWAQNKGIDKDSVAINRYNDMKWNALPSTFLSEDDKYLYFKAETPGFSPFAITGEIAEKEIDTQSQPEADFNRHNGYTTGSVERTENEENTSISEKRNMNTPAFELIYGIAGLLGIFLYKRR